MALHTGPLKIVSGSLLLLALVFQIVSLASHYWLTFESRSSRAEFNAGLWKLCVDSRAVSTCADLPSRYENDDLKAGRGLIIVSVLLTLASAGLIGASVCTDRANLLLGAAGVLLLQAILQAGGVGAASRYVDHRKDETNGSYGWSLYLGAVATVLYAIAGACAFGAKREQQTTKL